MFRDDASILADHDAIGVGVDFDRAANRAGAHRVFRGTVFRLVQARATMVIKDTAAKRSFGKYDWLGAVALRSKSNGLVDRSLSSHPRMFSSPIQTRVRDAELAA